MMLLWAIRDYKKYKAAKREALNNVILGYNRDDVLEKRKIRMVKVDEYDQLDNEVRAMSWKANY